MSEEQQELKPAQLDEVISQIHKAEQVVRELCERKRNWTMSIPARPDEDCDLIIGKALHDSERTIQSLWQALSSPQGGEVDIVEVAQIISDVYDTYNIELKSLKTRPEFFYRCAQAVLRRLRSTQAVDRGK